MKKFKFLMMAVATMMLATLAGCNDKIDGIDDGVIDDGTAKAYLSVMINIPNNGNATKNTEHSGTDEIGTTAETDIKNVTLYFFSVSSVATSSNYDYAGTYLQTLFVSSMGTGITSGNVVGYTSTTQTVTGLVAGGNYHVYAVVNGATNLVLTSATTEREFLDNSRVTGNYNTTGLVGATAHTTNGWLMSSRGAAIWNGRTEAFFPLGIALNNSLAFPATATLNVERVMGKLDLTAHTSNEYSVVDGASVEYAKVEILDAKVMNTRKDGYLFRHMTSISQTNANAFFGASEVDGFAPLVSPTYDVNKVIDSQADYIIDPQTKNKNLTTLASSHANWYHAMSGAIAMPAVGITQTLGYTLENTMHSTMQLNGFTTGLKFRAQVRPVNIIVSTGPGTNASIAWTAAAYPTFYSHDNKFYNNVQAMTDAGIPINDVVVTDAVFSSGVSADIEAAFEELKLNNVTRCDNGICYYNYWIKHQTDDQHMAVMEYGIVRNNVYKMKVTGISRIGESTEDIDPEEENEKTEVFIKVELNVLPWIIRLNDDIIL